MLIINDFFAVSVGKLDFTKIKSPKTTNEPSQLPKLTSSSLIKLNDTEIHLVKHEDLKEVQLIGSGEFGLVKRMIHTPSKLEFAVKVFYMKLFT